jgi:TPR repeat protein
MLNFFTTENYLYLLGYRTNISLGNCHHYGIHTDVNFNLARKYYSLALKTQRATALYQLSLLSNDEGYKGEALYFSGLRYEYIKEWKRALIDYETSGKEQYAPAMYLAGRLFKADRITNNKIVIKKDIVSELNWYRKGAVLYSAHALNALVEMSHFEPTAALYLAEMYEQGEIGGKRDLIISIHYYQKASDLQSKEAAYRLGELYEFGDQDLERDPQRAFDYYQLAAVSNCKFGLKALSNLERIAKNLDDICLITKVATLYQQEFKQSLSAFNCYRQISDRNSELAFSNMMQLADNNTDCAFEWGKFSEKNSLAPKHSSEKYYYFSLAACAQHLESIKYLETLAAAGDTDAQYTLARSYYVLNNFPKSIILLVNLIEQQHALAIAWIKDQSMSADQCLLLAEYFEQGNKKTFIEWTLYFYKKALSKDSNEAAFRLAKLYSNSSLDKAREYFNRAQQLGYSEVDCHFELGKLYERNDLIENNLEMACEFYAKAAMKHHELSLECLKSIAQSEDMKAQMILANVYYHQNNFERAICLVLQLAEQKYDPAIAFLKNTNFSKEHYLFIAKIYEQGTEEIKLNIHHAIYFYSKAYEAGDHKIAFYIGQLYQIPDQITGISIDFNKACEYFIKAARHGCLEAEMTLNQLAEEMNPELQLKIGNLYRDPPFNNSLKALHWYQQVLEGKNLDSKLDLDAMLTKMLEAKGVKFSMKDLSKLDQPKNLSFSLNNFDFFREQSNSQGNRNIPALYSILNSLN